jgi:hypothetical protein
LSSRTAIRNETVEFSVLWVGPESPSAGVLGDPDPEKGQPTRVDFASEHPTSGFDENRVGLDRHDPKTAIQVVSRVETAVEADIVNQLWVNRR